MKTSSNGLSIIKEFEGLRLESYLCPAKVWTIGYGHTEHAKPNMVINEREAEEYLLLDVQWAEDAVNSLVKTVLTQNQFDALVSFVFNIGRPKFKRSTLLIYINANKMLEASKEFDKWVYAKGTLLNGLVRRRQNEKELFLK